MPVPAFTYVYLILFITALLCTIRAAFKRDETMFEAFLVTIPLAFIGFMSNLNSVPKLFNLNGF